MKFKFNWGTGIILSIIIFMSVTISTAVYMMNQDVSLVSENYYDQAIKYQEQIDRIKRTNKLDEENILLFDGKILKITIPTNFLTKNISGEIHFYRPSDNERDIRIPLRADSLGLQVIPMGNLQDGLWKVKVNWLSGQDQYFVEKRIFIN